MAAIAHEQLSKPRGFPRSLVRSCGAGMRLTSPAAPRMAAARDAAAAAESQPRASIHAIHRLA